MKNQKERFIYSGNVCISLEGIKVVVISPRAERPVKVTLVYEGVKENVNIFYDDRYDEANVIFSKILEMIGAKDAEYSDEEEVEKTKKVILNKSWGGFEVSKAAYDLFLKKGGHVRDLGSRDREDPILIQVVEELGGKASGENSALVVVEIPADLDYEIDEYDGYEVLHEKVPTW